MTFPQEIIDELIRRDLDGSGLPFLVEDESALRRVAVILRSTDAA